VGKIDHRIHPGGYQKNNRKVDLFREIGAETKYVGKVATDGQEYHEQS
jgi:hypothetical protein